MHQVQNISLGSVAIKQLSRLFTARKLSNNKSWLVFMYINLNMFIHVVQRLRLLCLLTRSSYA